VMISDGIDEVVMIADLKAGRGDTIGRVGQGPGEYKTPDALYPLPNGGTLLVDLGNGRLNFLGPDGKYRESTPIAQSNGDGMLIVLPRATDGQGRIYFQPFGGRPGQQIPDSGSIVRWDRARAKFDTVAKVKLPTMNTQSSGGATSRQVRIRPRPFPAADGWSAGPDGRIALARASDYHVDVVGADGRIARGRPVAYPAVAIRDADKREWVAEQAGGLRVSMENRNGQISMAFGRGGGPDDAAEQAIAETEWPANKPPFGAASVWVSPTGETWIEKAVPSGAPRVMDVFDGAGNLKSRVVLPAGRRLVGFGNGVIYLRHSDENDLQHLERYRL
jgi:hypothetical protein